MDANGLCTLEGKPKSESNERVASLSGEVLGALSHHRQRQDGLSEAPENRGSKAWSQFCND